MSSYRVQSRSRLAPATVLMSALLVPVSLVGQARKPPPTPTSALQLRAPTAVTRSTDGVLIEYGVPSTSRDGSRIEIVDAQKALVRSWALEAPRTDKVGPDATRADAFTSGSVTWDLRHQGPLLPDGTHAATGPLVAPGNYVIHLKTNTGGRLQTLRVDADPKDATSVEDVRETVALAISLRDAVSRANQALRDIQTLRSQLADRVANARSPVVGLAGDVVKRRLGEGEQQLAGGPAPAGAPSSPAAPLNERLLALERRVQDHEGALDPDMNASAKELLTALDAALDHLSGIAGNELKAFNELLTRGSMTPLDIPATFPKPVAQQP
jgi:hypothetical protein